ncbi:ABC transporter ATP-binding protein [Pleurocapsa sp. PCC 7319]|uniref:ABC transporter ATP-binding protein n=1 Tax=Pleurocapsa sp. PCC 7319 TaxID=118161 RepID=UPI000346E81B|nr:ABC transporter ATP-binding protein [Pleurocapsa sp. PCC 7319]
MSQQTTIEVEHLSKVYGSTVAIEDVHFSVDAGEIIGFLGPNGAGKTTTMRILAGYLPATSGTAKIAGYDVHRNSMQVRSRIGYLPETPPLYTGMTVKGFLHFVAKIKGIRAGDRHRKVDNAMVRCQLKEKENVAIRKLSKGYRQRVGIAQAIVHEPPVIILDEPTVGLDPRQIIEVRNLIKSLAGDHTIILSTHILPEASMICDRVTIINRGKVVTTNTPSDLQAQLESSAGYEIEVAGNLESILPLLREIPGVTEINESENSLSAYSEHNFLNISCDSDTEVGKDIAAVIVQQGLDLYELRRTRPSLEDVFLELTTEEPLAIDN